jgi:hypothetical protein
MSDTSAPAAPPSAPNPTPQAQTEVPINTEQTSSPNPISNQAPDKPQLSRREAIQAAFDRANKPRDNTRDNTREMRGKPADNTPPKAAEAKVGHNKPPEPTEKEAINLKKPPGEQQQQPRDKGRFAPRQATNLNSSEEQTEPAKGTGEGQEKSSTRTLPETAPFRDPPVRMSDKAKSEWHATPESVRGDIHRVQNEFVKAYHHYKGTHEAFQPIRRFHDMAQQHGTTLEQALINYTSMEQKLRADVVGGLDVIVNNLNLKAPNGAKLGLRDIAYHVLSQSPEQLQQVQMGNAQQAQTSQIGALHQEVRGLKDQLAQMHTAQQFTYTRSQVDQFADSHPRFDELGTEIENELKLGFDLESAYRRAELLKPASTAAQTRATAPQTRAPADRSISGSPGGTGANSPATRSSGKTVGRREAIANAIKRVNGGL